jgi:hypothetical protein
VFWWDATRVDGTIRIPSRCRAVALGLLAIPFQENTSNDEEEGESECDGESNQNNESEGKMFP